MANLDNGSLDYQGMTNYIMNDICDGILNSDQKNMNVYVLIIIYNTYLEN